MKRCRFSGVLFRTLPPFLAGAFLVGFSAWPSNTAAQTLGITYQNATNIGGGCYRLTQAQSGQRGAVWYVGTVDVSQSWEMTADVYLGNSNNGADGMVFVLRDLAAGTIGGGGGLMGYGGTGTQAIEPSVGVQMDTYQGLANHGDPNYDHLAIFRDGGVNHNSADALSDYEPALTSFGNIENNQEYQLRVTYNAPTQEMTVYWDCVERISEVIDIEDILGTNIAKWGFTAATGWNNNLHRVCNATWTEVEDVVLPDTTVCAGVPVDLTLSDYALNAVWSPAFGLSSTAGNAVTATVSESQTYTVTYEDVCEDEFTIEVDVNVAELPETGLPADTVACNGNAMILNSGPWPAGITGMWNDGSTDEAITVPGPGTYSLTIEENASGCTATESVEVTEVILPALSLGDDQTTCPYEPVSFDFSGNDPNLSFTWNGVPGTTTYTTAEAGTITMEWGLSICTASDAMELLHYPAYDVVWEEDPVVLCLEEIESVSALDAGWSGGNVSWLWSDGSNGNSITLSNPGPYSVEITTPNCTFNYDLDVQDSPNQGVDLGPDVLLCDAETVTFSSGYSAAATTWVSGGDAEGTQSASTNVAGMSETVIVKVDIGECIERDTVEVAHVPYFETGLPSDLDLCLNDSLELVANAGADAYTWNNGVDQPNQWVHTAGTYTVNSEVEGCVFSDDVAVNPSANVGVDLGADAVACNAEPVVLTSGYAPDETLWWVNGVSQGTGASWTVLNQDATVVTQVTIGACVERDTVVVDYAPLFNTGLPSSLSLCNGDSTWVSANAGAPEYQWSTGSTQPGTWIDSPGTYTLTTPIQGCMYEASVNVQNVPLPVFDLGPNQTICAGESILLNTGLAAADQTMWSTGGTDPTLDVSTAGMYSVTVTENGCSSTDEVTIAVQALPIFDLGPDQQLCPDEEAFVYIYPLPEEATFSWNIAHFQPELTTNAPGVYTALVNWNGCLWTDEVIIERAASIFIDIAEPLSFCEGESMVVSAENPDNLFPISYDWSNGETTPAIRIDRQGIYEVTAANACDTVSKAFQVTLDYCECPVYVPNAFTPDNDGANDLFKPMLGCEPDAYLLEIFNTWGEVIFATDDPETGWFGQVEEDPASTEHSGYFTRSNVYHWRISVEFPDEDNPVSSARLEFQGHVHMIR